MANQSTPTGTGFPARLCRWLLLRPYWALALAVLIVLGPFLAKPFNIDDPLFIWAARHIQTHPTDPYGFEVNWYGIPLPMWQTTQNPPLACYYIALTATVLGWSELALHSAFLLPALAVILGTYRLARRFCKQPLLAAGVTLFTPVFLVSSSSVMCDTLMLAFWVWAVVLWVEGLEQNKFKYLIGSSVLVALAALTKYFGACLIPLLFAYAFIQQRRMGRWAACLLIPVAALAVYQWATHALYGQGLLRQLSGYAVWAQQDAGISRTANTLITLAFTGGCLAILTFLAPFLWPTRTLLTLLVGVVAFALALFFHGTIWKPYGTFAGSSRLLVEIQMIFWAVGGASLLALAISDIRRHRDSASWLLGLWVGGTFVFTAFCNWTINGRSILPLLPAAAILLARRLELNPQPSKVRKTGMAIALAAGAVLALLVARADHLFAVATRHNAIKVCDAYSHRTSTLWFEGHWGFQYYMESFGARPLITGQPVVQNEDFLAIPGNNSNLSLPSEQQAHRQTFLEYPGPACLSTLHLQLGAGFYTSMFGPLPFAFGRVPPESVAVYVPNVASP